MSRDDLLRRPLYLYSLPAEVLSTLVPKDVTAIGGSAAVAEETATATAVSESTTGSEPTTQPQTPANAALAGRACSLCGLAFATVAEQRGHLKSDLHHYNLKQKLRGQAPVSEAVFEQLMGDLDESLSGEEDEDDEDDDSDDEGEGGDDEKRDTKEDRLATLLKKQAALGGGGGGGGSGGGGGGGDGDDNEDNGGDRKRPARGDAEAASLQPFVWFGSSLLPDHTYFGVYRALFRPEELEAGPGGADRGDGGGAALLAAVRARQLAPMVPPPPASSSATGLPAAPPAGGHVFLCMIGGGHFAAMVVALAPRRTGGGKAAAGNGAAAALPMNREATVLAHKTFHRYTTRRKQGGSQAANDAAKGAAHSAGASLRRYNEQALVEDVRGLLRAWKPLLDTAALLFVRATGVTNRRTLFGDGGGGGGGGAQQQGGLLAARDPRLRRFPFSTRRPTQKEMMRAFIELTRLQVRTVEARADKTDKTDKTDKADKAKATPKPQPKPETSPEEEEALLHTTQLQALARRSKVPALLAYLQSSGLSAAAFRFAPADAPAHHHAPTLLHWAAAQNAPALVSALLLRAGADPAVRNADGKTPFDLAGDRATRDAFRVARGELAASAAASAAASGGRLDWDWDAAHVPPPLARAEAGQRAARDRAESARKEAERRRAEEARLAEEARVAATTQTTTTTTTTRGPLLAGVLKSAQEIREEEARGLTPEQRQRLERERRARAAEARMRRAG